MRRILIAMLAASAAAGWASQAPACGSALRIEVLLAIADDPIKPASVEKLRAAGPEALDELFSMREQLVASLNAESTRKATRPIARAC